MHPDAPGAPGRRSNVALRGEKDDRFQTAAFRLVPNEILVFALAHGIIRAHNSTITARFLAFIGDENARCAPAFL
jgi:hypothetical protein